MKLTEKMPDFSLEAYRSAFNADSGRVRFLSLVSPKCPVCVEGFEASAELFRGVDASGVSGAFVWLKMFPGDSRSAAFSRAASFPDRRFVHRWDASLAFGRLMTIPLKLKDVAWDVYLLYGPDAVWSGDYPPVPSFWMHQLFERNGADQDYAWEPGRFRKELSRLLRVGTRARLCSGARNRRGR